MHLSVLHCVDAVGLAKEQAIVLLYNTPIIGA